MCFSFFNFFFLEFYLVPLLGICSYFLIFFFFFAWLSVFVYVYCERAIFTYLENIVSYRTRTLSFNLTLVLCCLLSSLSWLRPLGSRNTIPSGDLSILLKGHPSCGLQIPTGSGGVASAAQRVRAACPLSDWAVQIAWEWGVLLLTYKWCCTAVQRAMSGSVLQWLRGVELFTCC